MKKIAGVVLMLTAAAAAVFGVSATAIEAPPADHLAIVAGAYK